MRSLIAAAIVAASITAFAQSSQSTPHRRSFDVASIKPSAPGASPLAPGAVGPPTGGTVRFPRGTLRRLVMYAYNIQPLMRHDPQPVGGPDWADRDQFDIMAKGPETLTLADARRMMLSLLEDRFRLRSHVERREIPVYALLVSGRNGQIGRNLTVSKIDCARYSAVLTTTGRRVLAELEGPDCGLRSGGAPGFLGGANTLPQGAQVVRGIATMTEVVNAMARDREMDRPIVDRTGLAGTYDIDLSWVPARSGSIVAEPGDVLPLVTAVQEQLGLTLDARREPRDVVVIDAAARPMPD
jgi:uncharacterized protein (TIGR03435 family)